MPRSDRGVAGPSAGALALVQGAAVLHGEPRVIMAGGKDHCFAETVGVMSIRAAGFARDAIGGGRPVVFSVCSPSDNVGGAA